MKILFILKESTLHERMGLMQLGACLKDQGHEVRMVLAEKAGLEGLRRTVSDFSPSLIGYSAMTGEHLRLLEINRFLKRDFQFLALFGGPHATFFPDFIQEESVDGVCVGEGDLALAEFCRRWESRGDYWTTPNFMIKHQGRVFRNELLPLVEDLDRLPFPDRELMYQADPDLREEGTKYFYSSRGCPYRCSYCFNLRYNEIYSHRGKVVRFRSPESLVEEIRRVKERYPLNLVWIGDDAFLLKPPGWFEKFRKLYRQRVGLPFCCNVRANQVREKAIAVLKEAGLDFVLMGVECGNERVANEILGRGLNNQQILAAAEIFKKFGVRLFAQNLIGMPVKDSFRIDLETLDFNLRLKPAFAWSSLLYPYPGTRVERYAREHDFVDEARADLETNKRSTIFKYSPGERRRIENLHKLFGVIVWLPFLRRAAAGWCALPLTGLYTRIFYIFYGYMLKVKLAPFISWRKEIAKYFRLWLKLARKR